MDSQPDIVILTQPISGGELSRLVDQFFGDMVKYVVDIEKNIIALGGELHADGEAALLQAGSRQDHLWGANYYPGRGEDACIEYTSMINIRPARGNRGMEVLDPAIRDRIRTNTFALIGHGEAI